MIDDNKEQLYTLNALVNGELISENFLVPQTPSPKTFNFDSISHDSFSFSIPRGNSYVTGCKVFIWDNIPPYGDLFLPLNSTESNSTIDTITREIFYQFPKDSGNEDIEIVAYDLSAGHPYSFYLAYITDVGLSPNSIETESFFISPLSQPAMFSANSVSEHSMELSWTRPKVIAEYLRIDISSVFYRVYVNGKQYFNSHFNN